MHRWIIIILVIFVVLELIHMVLVIIYNIIKRQNKKLMDEIIEKVRREE